MSEALTVLLGEQAKGLSPNVISRLKAEWVSESTIRKSKDRTDFNDRPHTLNTTLTPVQEAVVVKLRRRLAPLDDLVAVVKAFIEPKASRSGVHRCLTRHGVNNLRPLRQEAPKPQHKPFKTYEPGCLHIDVKYLPERPDETKRLGKR